MGVKSVEAFLRSYGTIFASRARASAEKKAGPIGKLGGGASSANSKVAFVGESQARTKSISCC